MAEEDFYNDDFDGSVRLAQLEGYADQSFFSLDSIIGEVNGTPQNRNGNQPPTEVIPSQERVPTTHQFGDIVVEFPGEPYASQVKMMEDIIDSLENGYNSLIESPTGSGKTLAILCAVLAWRKRHYLRDSLVPPKKIFYCTRTHAQGSSVIKELRKTVYAQPDAMPRLKVTILGSRDQMCINESIISKATDESCEQQVEIDDLCEKLVRNFRKNSFHHTCSSSNSSTSSSSSVETDTCRFYKKQSDDYFYTDEAGFTEIRDIEDLRKMGATTGCCPYFGSKRQVANADLVICPYNYIISGNIRQKSDIDLKNSVVIFDEGHNLEKALCAEGSMSLSSKTFGNIFLQCNKLTNAGAVSPRVKHAVENFASIFRNLRTWLTSFRGNDDLPKGMEVVNKLRELGLGKDDMQTRNTELECATQAEEGPVLSKSTAQQIVKVLSVLEYLYKNEHPLDDYFLQVEKPRRGDEKISIICINPAIVFREIASETSSIAVTSGTLRPLDRYESELSIKFNNPLCLPQIIPEDRYYVAKLGVGPEGVLPILDYDERQQTHVKKHIGELIVRICEVFPTGGILVFVPSKDDVNKLMSEWRFAVTDSNPSTTILDRLKDVKHVVSEYDMKTPKLARKLLNEYRQKSKEGRGAILLGVHRGKVSEGVDFSDMEARAVINIGIPLAPKSASQVMAREIYFKEIKRNAKLFSQWYETDAMRAVNQCLGRSVRHTKDWGAIILVDPRFLQSHFRIMLPKWIQHASVDFNDTTNNGFESMISELRQFVNRVSAVA